MVQLLLGDTSLVGEQSAAAPTSPPQTGHEGVLLQVSLQGSSHHLLTPPPHPSPHQVMMFPWEDLKSELKKKAKTGSLLPPCQASSVPSVDTTARWGGGGGGISLRKTVRGTVWMPQLI